MDTLSGIVIVLGLVIFVIAGTMGILTMLNEYNLPTKKWECTESKVVKETLPRYEECVQYSLKKEKK